MSIYLLLHKYATAINAFKNQISHLPRNLIRLIPTTVHTNNRGRSTSFVNPSIHPSVRSIQKMRGKEGRKEVNREMLKRLLPGGTYLPTVLLIYHTIPGHPNNPKRLISREPYHSILDIYLPILGLFKDLF